MAKGPKETPAEKKREKSKSLLMNWVNVSVMNVENERMRMLLYDGVTGLPTVSLVVADVEKTLTSHSQVGLVHIELEKTSTVQENLGYTAVDHILNHIAGFLQTFKGKILRADDIVTAVMRNGSEFAIILSPPRKNQYIAFEDVLSVRNRLMRGLRDKLRSSLDQSIYRMLHLRAGIAIIEKVADQPAEHLLALALESARTMAAERDLEKKEKQIDRLRAALDDGSISLVHQPVVELKNYKSIGYEALSRGPEGLEHPEFLFKLAVAGDMTSKLDKICRVQALAHASEMPEGILFVNVHPLALNDPSFLDTAEQLRSGAFGIDKDSVVFEISENFMTTDPTAFRHALSLLQANGLRLCIDDAGSGFYMGLELIARTKPDYVKINSHIVRDIDKDEVKRELAATIAKFAEGAGATVIAEAVETEAELKTLKNLGLKYAQGFLFAEPAAGYPAVKKPAS